MFLSNNQGSIYNLQCVHRLGNLSQQKHQNHHSWLSFQRGRLYMTNLSLPRWLEKKFYEDIAIKRRKWPMPFAWRIVEKKQKIPFLFLSRWMRSLLMLIHGLRITLERRRYFEKSIKYVYQYIRAYLSWDWEGVILRRNIRYYSLNKNFRITTTRVFVFTVRVSENVDNLNLKCWN